MKRALDVTPHRHAIWCSIEDGKPFANDIVSRKWSPDEKQIVFMLETFNFAFRDPNEMMEVVELAPSKYETPEIWAEREERDRKFLAGYIDPEAINRMMAL